MKYKDLFKCSILKSNVFSAKKAKKMSSMVNTQLIKPTAQEIQKYIIAAAQRGDNSCIYCDERLKSNSDFRHKIMNYFEKLGYVANWAYTAQWLEIRW